MKKTLYTGVAVAALASSSAMAGGHLAYTPGEGDFSWDSYNAWAEKAPDLSGETVTIAGPWLQPEDEVFRSVIAYFADATGVTNSRSSSFAAKEAQAAANTGPSRLTSLLRLPGRTATTVLPDNPSDALVASISGSTGKLSAFG